MSTTTSPLRPPAPRKSPTASQSSPCAARDRVERLGHRLLVRAALGRAALGLGGDLLGFSFSARSSRAPACSAAICSPIARSCRPAASAASRIAAQRAPPGSRPAGCAVGRGELLAAGPRACGRTGSASPRAPGAARRPRLVAEVALERLGEVPVLGRRRPRRPCVRGARPPPRALDGERGLELARDLLELAATNSALTPVCSRSSTRAPISIASTHDGGRVLAAPLALARPAARRTRRRRRGRRSSSAPSRTRTRGRGEGWQLPWRTELARYAARHPTERQRDRWRSAVGP